MKPLYYGKQYIDEDDINAVAEVLRSELITSGPKVVQLEKDLCDLTGAKYAVAIANGTAALHLACLSAGIVAGDEVITTPMTFAASANSILYCGGVPVFADINPHTWNIDPKSIKENITAKTKAVIAVDFTGQACELDEIKNICMEYNLVLLEDASHSIGTKYKGISVGNIADITTFSFHPVKTVTAGEGGAITTNDENIYNNLCMLRTHGMTNAPNDDYEKELLANHPVNLQMQTCLGFNYRITDFQAALLSSQLKKLDKFGKRKKEIVTLYDEALKNLNGVVLQKEIVESDSLKHLYVLRFDLAKFQMTRKEICDALAKEDVICNVHYIPVYYHPYYRKLGYKKGICPNAEALYEEILTLPLYYSMTNDDVMRVIRAIKKVGNDLCVVPHRETCHGE